MTGPHNMIARHLAELELRALFCYPERYPVFSFQRLDPSDSPFNVMNTVA